uniref:Retrotrans_gag domain-containing protein n=1 Tax=Caenorhabditis japonica TaxID=281687 RepID=A0A8R1IQ76_CAEJA
MATNGLRTVPVIVLRSHRRVEEEEAAGKVPEETPATPTGNDSPADESIADLHEFFEQFRNTPVGDSAKSVKRFKEFVTSVSSHPSQKVLQTSPQASKTSSQLSHPSPKVSQTSPQASQTSSQLSHPSPKVSQTSPQLSETQSPLLLVLLPNLSKSSKNRHLWLVVLPLHCHLYSRAFVIWLQNSKKEEPGRDSLSQVHKVEKEKLIEKKATMTDPKVKMEDYNLKDEVQIMVGNGQWKNTKEVLSIMEGRIQKFSDGKAPELADWLNEFGRLCYRIDVPAAMGVGLLPFFLKSPALSRYNLLTADDKKSWNSLTSALMKLYESELDKELATQEITNLKQGKLSITQFAEKLRKLGGYAYYDIDDAARERLTATHLLNGMKKDIRREIHRLPKRPTTLRDMSSQARKIECLLDLEEKEDEEDDLVAAVQYQDARFQDQRGGYGNQGYRGRGFRRSFNNSGNGCEGCRNQGYGCQGCGRQSFGNQGFGGQHRAFGDGFQRQRQPFMQKQFGQQGLNQTQQGFGQLAIGQGQANNNNVRPNGRAGRPSVNSVTTFLVGMLTLTLLPSATGLQVCGFGLTGNTFIPPSPISCVFSGEIKLQKHPINVYWPTSVAIEMSAFKCFQTEYRTTSFEVLSFYISTSASMGRQISVPVEDCRKAVYEKEVYEKKLIEISPGVFKSN